MISMPQIQSIRRMRRNGESIASIARKQHVSEPTVRKYLRMDDLSEKPPVRKRRGSVIDPYLPLIEQWLAEDRGNWRKQRHTATRIWERLRDEHGAEVSLSTVTRAVARLRRESSVDPGGAFMDLVWHPGEAQADFGEVDVLYRGAVQRMRHFVLDFPYSNIGLAQLMPGENAECTCQALLGLFDWLGGVPERIVFDNAAGVGRRTGGGIRWTRLFQAFQAHYGFESSLCSPYAGHEKGAVEAKVGMVRRKLFVPRPSVWNLENFNSRLPDRCLELGGKPHHAKDEEEAVLFAEDRGALLPLPGRRFDVVTWKRMRTDKYGVVTLDGRHRYSTDASHARRDVLVGLRALEIEILDVEGTRLAVHPRAYGQASTSSEDPSMQLAMPCNRPSAWPNSLVREMLPDPLSEWLDRQNEGERRGQRGRGDAHDPRIDRRGRRGRRRAPRGQARGRRGTRRIRRRQARPERIRHRVHHHGRGRGRSGMMAARNDDGLYAKARSLFISKATMDDFTGWATPRQTDAVYRLFDTELANRERSKRERLLRRARFPVVKSLDGYDFSNVRLPDGYALDGLLDLDFVPRAQDLVFYGRTGRGKTHLAIGLGMRAVERGLNVRFHQTAELVLQLGKAKRDGNLDTMLRDIGRADLIILDEFGYVPFDIDGARLLYQIIAGSYERRSIVFTTNIEFSKWGTIFADDKLAAAIIDRIVHHGRLLEFTGQSRRVSEALMFGRTSAGPASGPKEKTKEQAGTLLD